MPESEVREIALRAIAHAVGAVVLPHGFRAPLPEGAARPQDDPPPDAAKISALDAPLAALERALDPSAASPSASLVICTRDRPEQLERCLAALTSVGTGFLEIIVVDNGPANPATRAVAERFPGIVYVPEPRTGLSIARNTGVRASRGAIVAFTDDDVIIHPNWPARLRGAFADPATMVVTGLVLPSELETEAQVMFEQELGGFGQGFRPLVYGEEFFSRTRDWGVPVWKLGAGANMAFRREVFDSVGYFDERLGPGASGGCGDDSELWYRILAAGHRCRYEPTAVVFHRHRETWDGMLQQLHSYMHGHVIALFIQYWRHGHTGNVYRALVVLPRYYAFLLLKAFLGRLGARRRLLRTELAGWISGLMASLRMARASRRR
jgi:GT2 family glycosyltransferase